MKKLFISFLSVVLLASCGNSQSIEDAKKAMLEGESTISTDVDNTIEKDSSDSSEDSSDIVVNNDSVVEDKTSYSVDQIDEAELLQFNALSATDIQDGEVEISGTTVGEIDKITVSFENKDSSYPDDLYTLKTFKPGAKSFKYLASSRFKVLDFGVNTYVFTAYAGRETSQTRLTINLVDSKETPTEPIGETNKLIGTEVSAELASLPTGGSYGNPVMLGEDAFTYSDINGLEIKKLDTRDINCEDLTDYLSDNINTWFYWNTCRDFIKEKAITFNVIRLKDDEYVYQKHYVDFVHNFYGTYDIETGTGVTKENIQEKNSELKEQNDTFLNISLIDSLFKDIVN